MTYHVQILLLVRQPLFDRAALLLTQTSWVLPPLSVGKMTLRLYGALNYSHGFSKGPSFGTGRDPMLHYGLGNELSKSGRFADAVESFEEAIRVNPNYTAAYRQLGKSLEKLGARTRPDVPMKMVLPWVSRRRCCTALAESKMRLLWWPRYVRP